MTEQQQAFIAAVKEDLNKSSVFERAGFDPDYLPTETEVQELNRATIAEVQQALPLGEAREILLNQINRASTDALNELARTKQGAEAQSGSPHGIAEPTQQTALDETPDARIQTSVADKPVTTRWAKIAVPLFIGILLVAFGLRYLGERNTKMGNEPPPEIRAAYDTMATAMTTGDYEGVFSFYTQDCKFIEFEREYSTDQGDTAKHYNSKEYSLEYMKNEAKRANNRPVSAKVTILRFELQNDDKAEVQYDFEATRSNGSTKQTDKLRFKDIWQKRNGSWKIIESTMQPWDKP